MRQSEQTYRFRVLLRLDFADRDDVLISGEGNLRSSGSSGSGRLAPGLRGGVRCRSVRHGGPQRLSDRRGELGRPPAPVPEAGTRSKGRMDHTVKCDACLGYGVAEHWRFDHTGGRYHVSALAGDVLVDGEYQPMEIPHEPDGLVWVHSAVHGGAERGTRVWGIAESWSGVLRDLRQRGPGGPRLVAGDGHLGIWGALRNVYPDASKQRCRNHRIIDVFDRLSKRQHEHAKLLLRAIPCAPTRAEAKRLRDVFTG